MKTLITLLLAAIVISTNGCMAPTVKALSKDNAAVKLDIRTIYGTGNLYRVMPPTNAVTTIKSNGDIVIERQ